MEVSIDFEYFDSNEKIMSLVAASIDYGLEKPFAFDLTSSKNGVKEHLENIKKDKDTLLAYAVIAEARSLISLGFDPLDFEWIDLYAEFIMLCNSNNRYCYGNYINHTGSIVYSVPPDPSMTEEEKEADTADHTECPKNLVNCAYKLLNVRLDASHKDAMRDLILSRDIPRIKEYMHEILEYCASDTKYLREIYKAICRAYELEGLTDFRQDMLARGRYAAAVAKSEALGIPIDFKLLDKIIEKTPEILQKGREEVNAYFNFFVPEFQRPPITRKNGKIFTYKPTPAHKDMASYQRYVESLKIESFPRTKTGKFKADKDTLEEFGYWGGLESLWKYNKTESSLKWFNKDNKDGFFERVGSDKVVRPYYGIFGTQTGRNAAKAKTFPLAMSSWLRAIISPGVLPLREGEDGHLFGQCIIGSDFSQQEVYVAAILSGDKNLLEAYNSGDVYLAFAIQANLAPEGASKKTHKEIRDLCKSTVLG